MTNKKRPHILFHRGTPWHSEIQCSTKTLAMRYHQADYRVSYLQSILHPAHLLFPGVGNEIWKHGSRWEDGVWVARSCGVTPFFNQNAWLSQMSRNLNYRVNMPSIRKEIHGSGWGDPDVIWTTTPGSSALKDVFPNAKLFFHVVDYYPAFCGEGIRSVERQDYARADHIFSIGHALADYLVEELNVPSEKITVLGQGAPVEEYENQQPVPNDLKEIPKPIALWVGVSKKLDQKLLSSLAAGMKEYAGSVVLIGPPSEWMDDFLAHHPNVCNLGPRHSSEVSAYLQHADVGIMLYNRERAEVYYGQNPLKLYEYAAAGLPILSTDHREFKSLKTPTFIVRTEADVLEGLKSVIANKDQLTHQALEFAQHHSWSNVCERSQQKISDFLGV